MIRISQICMWGQGHPRGQGQGQSCSSSHQQHKYVFGFDIASLKEAGHPVFAFWALWFLETENAVES